MHGRMMVRRRLVVVGRVEGVVSYVCMVIGPDGSHAVGTLPLLLWGLWTAAAWRGRHVVPWNGRPVERQALRCGCSSGRGRGNVGRRAEGTRICAVGSEDELTVELGRQHYGCPGAARPTVRAAGEGMTTRSQRHGE